MTRREAKGKRATKDREMESGDIKNKSKREKQRRRETEKKRDKLFSKDKKICRNWEKELVY